MKPTCSFVLCVVDDCRTTLCSNLKWLRKDHNCLLSSINATASSALQSAEVTKGNNPKCDSNTNLFRVFYNRCGRQPVDLLFDVSCTSFWNEGEIRPVTRTTAFCYIHCNPSSIPSFFFSACFFFSRTFFNHGCSWVANVVVMLAGFCVIDFLGAFGCHGASWRWNPLSSSEPMFLWCWIFVIGGSTLYIVPWIIRTCFGFKSPFGEASTQVTSTTCRKMRRCWVMSGPVVTLKRRKMWCRYTPRLWFPQQRTILTSGRILRKSIVKGACLGFTSYSTGSCSGVHVYLYFNPTLLVHCWYWFYGIFHAILGWLLAWKLPWWIRIICCNKIQIIINLPSRRTWAYSWKNIKTKNLVSVLLCTTSDDQLMKI